MDIDKTYFVQIPLRPEEYNYEFSIIIGTTTYIIWIYYNRRMGKWILNMKDENNDSIIMGIPILIGSQLLSRFADFRIQDAKILFAFNLKNQYEEIGEFDLGYTATLIIARELS